VIRPYNRKSCQNFFALFAVNYPNPNFFFSCGSFALGLCGEVEYFPITPNAENTKAKNTRLVMFLALDVLSSEAII